MKKLTLFQRTLLGQILLFCVVAAASSAFSAFHLYKHLTAEYRSKGRAIASSIAFSSEVILSTSPAETTQAVIDEFLKIRGVAYVFVVDPDGEIIAHTFVPKVPNRLQTLIETATETQTEEASEGIITKRLQIPNRGEFIDLSAPILAGAGGQVHVGMDRGLILADCKKAIAHQLLLIAFLFLFAAIASYLLVKAVSRPLNKLTDYAHKLASHDFSATIDIRACNEISLLANTMQSMASEIGGFVGRLEQAVNEATSELQQTLAALYQEQEKSENLLLNILPEPIATQLKEGCSPIADGFAEATILFADLVGFTKLSEQVSPTQLVSWLNELFSGFDRLTEEHDLEKIKTIGDAYMVVGGIPHPRVDHAEAIAEMALDIQEEIAKFNAKHGTNLSIRIGINTGPVVAGVIGTKKFIYDLWGDAVNTASRMESHGIPGSIQVSASTYQRLRHRYQFEERGALDIKGKGKMLAYLLVSPKIPKTIPV